MKRYFVSNNTFAKQVGAGKARWRTITSSSREVFLFFSFVYSVLIILIFGYHVKDPIMSAVNGSVTGQCGLMVMTFASHAKGSQFDPGH